MEFQKGENGLENWARIIEKWVKMINLNEIKFRNGEKEDLKSGPERKKGGVCLDRDLGLIAQM